MTDKAHICVIITTFNSEKFVSEAIESVINQNLAPKEIIVVDNGSTDSTRTRVKSFGIPFYTQTKGRVGESRNLGIRQTISPFIKFLDADDLLKPHALESLHASLEIEESLFVYGRNLNFVDLTYPPLGSGLFAHTEIPIHSPTTLNSMVHRDVFMTFGLPEEDNFSWARWITKAKSDGLHLLKVEEVVGLRRIHNENLSLSENSKLELLKLARAQVSHRGIHHES
jgi:glycosyltransferase involved in cell wall biosynthesis